MSLNGSYDGVPSSEASMQGECSIDVALRTVSACGVVAYNSLVFAEKDCLFLERTARLADSSAGSLPSQATAFSCCPSWYNALESTQCCLNALGICEC